MRANGVCNIMMLKIHIFSYLKCYIGDMQNASKWVRAKIQTYEGYTLSGEEGNIQI